MQPAATSATSRLNFIENGAEEHRRTHDKIEPVMKEINALLKTYREAFAKLIENRKTDRRARPPK